MAWPVDTFYASAPGYSFNGTLPWPSGASIFTNFMNACGAYEQAARDGQLALENQGWTSTGQTYTGTAAPALPSDHNVPYAGACGTGQRSTRALIGDSGFTQVEVQFYSKMYKKEYRWVEDVAYNPGGDWVATGNVSNDPCVAALGSILTPSFGASTTASEIITQWNSEVIAAIGQIVAHSSSQILIQGGSCSGGGADGPINCQVWGVWSSGDWFSGTHTANIGNVARSTEQQGQWHLEMRVLPAGGAGEACATAQYAQISRAEESDRNNKPPRNNPARPPRTPWPPTFPIPGGGGYPPAPTTPNGGDNKIHFSSACSTTVIKTSTDIWDTNLEAQLTSGDIVLEPGYTLKGAYHPAVEFSFTTPGSLVSIQEGTPFQGYNTLKGAVVYDIDLQKWGKWKYDYTCIVEFTGTNAFNMHNFNYTDLGMTAGLLHLDGLIYLFDQAPTDSWIRYGKIGYYRLGMVHFLEARMDFRNYATGSVIVDHSMDGRNIDASLRTTHNYNTVLSYKVYPNQRSRWSTLTISGNYDLQYMEVRGNISCRR